MWKTMDRRGKIRSLDNDYQLLIDKKENKVTG
jgi:hypothetical protein